MSIFTEREENPGVEKKFNNLWRNVLLCLALMPVGMLVDAWMITKLWGWFVMNTFGVLPLTYSQSLGLSLFVYAIGLPFADKNKAEGSSAVERMIAMMFTRAIMVFEGWVVFLILGSLR